MFNISNSNNFYFCQDNTNENNFFNHDNNNLNDIFTFQDNILDFSFLPLSEKNYLKLELSENKKFNSNNDKEHINFLIKQNTKKSIKKNIFLLKGNEDVINTNNNSNYIYRKDAYYKHFKSIQIY